MWSSFYLLNCVHYKQLIKISGTLQLTVLHVKTLSGKHSQFQWNFGKGIKGFKSPDTRAIHPVIGFLLNCMVKLLNVMCQNIYKTIRNFMLFLLFHVIHDN
jgi:hypothetical protein